eukprot:GEZU01027624.1.p1 GENE.GEZU01027624.1~~GEZU01027624.1.p1  ORF type:complete len:328 (-),score=28.13 GEZU01027624.1:168-1151(-)
MSTTFWDSGTIVYSLPTCPENIWPQHVLSSPSSFCIFILTAIVSAVFALTIAVFYNSVELPHINKKIRTPSISNTMWIFYYAVVALRAVSNAVRFGVVNRDASFLPPVTFVEMGLHGLTALFLTLALNYQRRYRSGEIPGEATSIQSEVNNRRRTKTVLMRAARFIFSVESMSVFLLLQYFIISYLRVRISDLDMASRYQIGFYWAQIGSVVLQRLPIIVLVLVIIFQKHNIEVGPTRGSKVMLFLGMLCNLPNDLPLSFWAVKVFGELSNQCGLYFASYVDIFLVFYALSLIFFFFFLRAEYMRNQEECMFMAVSQSQDTFDFQRF